MHTIQQVLKRLRIAFLLTGTLLMVAAPAGAQRQSVIPDAALDNMLLKFQKIQADAKAQQQIEKELNTIIDEAIVKLNKWLVEKQQEQTTRTKNYVPGHKHSGSDMNLFPVWEAMPGPIPSLPEAKQTNFNSRYQAYIDNAIVLKKQLSDMMQQHLEGKRTDKKSMIEDSKSMADKNAIVKQMGGSDALMQMNEMERKKAAQNASNKIMTNPGPLSGSKNEGMNAMMQRLMTDPKYRESYNKMTDAQKEAELKKYMGNTIEERNDRDFEAAIKNRNDTYSAANIELLLGKSLQQMQEAASTCAEGTELANKYFTDIYSHLDEWYKKQYNSLPETNTHEKKGLAILIKCKETIVYTIQKKEAACRTILWSILKSNTKIAFGEFNDFIGRYPWGKSKNTSLIDGTYTEPKVAQAVTSIYDEMIRMTREAERMTRIFKGQQEQYELILK